MGLIIFNTTSNCLEFYNGGFWYQTCGSPACGNSNQPHYWRNLDGPQPWRLQPATASDDALAYGDLYQWGRATEGHEDRSSVTTSTNATTAVPNGGNTWDGLFITEKNSPGDWLTPQDNTLWEGEGRYKQPMPNRF